MGNSGTRIFYGCSSLRYGIALACNLKTGFFRLKTYPPFYLIRGTQYKTLSLPITINKKPEFECWEMTRVCLEFIEIDKSYRESQERERELIE